MTADEKLDWLGTLRSRIDVTPADRLLIYATGGLAYGHGGLSTALSRTSMSGCNGNNCQNGSVSDTKLGWTLGGGAEWAVTQNWSVKAEYLYYDLGSLSHSMVDNRPAFPAAYQATADLKGSIARAGVNYKFRGSNGRNPPLGDWSAARDEADIAVIGEGAFVPIAVRGMWPSAHSEGGADFYPWNTAQIP